MMATKALLLAAVVAVASGDDVLRVKIAFSNDALKTLNAANQAVAIAREGMNGEPTATVWAKLGQLWPFSHLSWNNSQYKMWMGPSVKSVGDVVEVASETPNPIHTGAMYVGHGYFSPPRRFPEYPVTNDEYGALNNWTIATSFGLSQPISLDDGKLPAYRPIFPVNVLKSGHATMKVPSNNFYIFLVDKDDTRTKVGTVVDTTTLGEITTSPVSFISFQAKEESIELAFDLDSLTFYKSSSDLLAHRRR